MNADLTANEALWDTPTTANFLGVPARTLDNWATTGKGPAFSKIGKHRRYRPCDVQSFVDDNKRSA